MVGNWLFESDGVVVFFPYESCCYRSLDLRQLIDEWRVCTTSAIPYSLICTSIAQMPCYQSSTPTHDCCAGVWTSFVLGHFWLNILPGRLQSAINGGLGFQSEQGLRFGQPVVRYLVTLWLLSLFRIQENR